MNFIAKIDTSKLDGDGILSVSIEATTRDVARAATLAFAAGFALAVNADEWPKIESLVTITEVP